jgi:hypothetical protein
VQYIGARKKYPNLRDSELMEVILELRHSVIPLDPEKEERIWVSQALITNVTELAWQILSVETADGIETSPFRNREWVTEAHETIEKVVSKHGLQDIKFVLDDPGTDL